MTSSMPNVLWQVFYYISKDFRIVSDVFLDIHAYVLAGYFGHDLIVLFYLEWLKTSKNLRKVLHF